MSIEYPERINLADIPTPIQALDTLSENLSVNLFVKRDDLTGTLLTGNKVRKLEFLLAEAKQLQSTVILTCGGVQSNHCRAAAVAGRLRGVGVVLFLRGEE